MATPSSTTSKSSSKDKEKEADEFQVPSVSADDEDLSAKDFRTSDDAQVAFLQGTIDEDTFAQVVGKYGKPSNPPYNRHAEVDGAYEVDLPKWAFSAPEGEGLTMQERQDAVDAKEEERKEATEEAEAEKSETSGSGMTSTTAPKSTTSGSSTSSSSSSTS